MFDELAAPHGRSLVIFGAGGLGRKVLSGLRQVGIEPLAFADNNSRLWGSTIEGVEVFPPREAAARFATSAAFVIAIWSPGADRSITLFRQQLQSLGCRTILSFVPLFRKHPDIFLPHGRIDVPRKAFAAVGLIRDAFGRLADDTSRQEFLIQLKWLLSTDFGPLPAANRYEQYFQLDLFSQVHDEVFVDCGAFDGDTILAVRRHYGDRFAQIVALEPEPENYRKLENYLASVPADVAARVKPLQVATAAARGHIRFKSSGLVSRAAVDGDLLVECVSLDELLADEAPTFIKMDIEGAEPDALAGGAGTIRRRTPILAVCVYHRQEHLWEIPLLIDGICGGYRFFLRRHGDEFGDVVCYAVPPHRLCKL